MKNIRERYIWKICLLRSFWVHPSCIPAFPNTSSLLLNINSFASPSLSFDVQAHCTDLFWHVLVVSLLSTVLGLPPCHTDWPRKLSVDCILSIYSFIDIFYKRQKNSNFFPDHASELIQCSTKHITWSGTFATEA